MKHTHSQPFGVPTKTASWNAVGTPFYGVTAPETRQASVVPTFYTPPLYREKHITRFLGDLCGVRNLSIAKTSFCWNVGTRGYFWHLHAKNSVSKSVVKAFQRSNIGQGDAMPRAP